MKLKLVYVNLSHVFPPQLQSEYNRIPGVQLVNVVLIK